MNRTDQKKHYWWSAISQYIHLSIKYNIKTYWIASSCTLKFLSILSKDHFWPLSSSFCRYFITPYAVVPAINKRTVGVKDGYKYFTNNLSHSSGRKPEMQMNKVLVKMSTKHAKHIQFQNNLRVSFIHRDPHPKQLIIWTTYCLLKYVKNW